MKTVKKFTRVNAKTVEEAVSALRTANAWALAGGTDLVGTMRFEVLPNTMYPQVLVNLAVYNKPYRATKAEESIAGKTIDVASAQAAGTAAVTEARALTLNKWKIQVAAGMVKKAILACA
jgi:CO/xanthine dehydrogenase FAD-binding subunit